jgi:hypothetical protein
MIQTAALAFPKPGHLAGRIVLSGRRYSNLKRETWERQAYTCARCPRYLPEPASGELHHSHGRGMGGGKRDDRYSELVCLVCHEQAKLERRESWVATEGGVA